MIEEVASFDASHLNFLCGCFFLQCWACLLFLFLCKRRGITYLANPGKNPLFSSLHTYFSQHRNLVGKFCKYSTQCGRPSYWGHNIKVVITTLLVNHHYYYIIMIIALRSWFGSFYEFYCSLANKKKNTKMISSKYLATLATFLLVFLPSGSQGKCQPRWSKDKDEIGFFSPFAIIICNFLFKWNALSFLYLSILKKLSRLLLRRRFFYAVKRLAEIASSHRVGHQESRVSSEQRIFILLLDCLWMANLSYA